MSTTANPTVRPAPRGFGQDLRLARSVWGRLPGARWAAAVLMRRDLLRELEVAEQARDAAMGLDHTAFEVRLGQMRQQLRRALVRGQAAAAAFERAQALGIVAAAAQRSLGLSPQRPQLLAALGLATGQAVEMGDCQGKTLALAMTAALTAWSGRPCHVIAASEELAHRAAAAMKPLYERCAVHVCVLDSRTPAAEILPAGRIDVLYTTARRLLSEAGQERRDRGASGDLLRRGLERMPGPARTSVLGAGLHVALVDDLDRVLLDDASMPFVISRPTDNPLLLEAVAAARQVADAFVPGVHIRAGSGAPLAFTDDGRQLLDEVAAQLPELWRTPRRRDELILQALVARDLLERGRHYEVHNDSIVFLDAPLGDLLPDRSLFFGLTQALEARAGLPLTAPPKTVERTSYQAFFTRYHHLAGIGSSLRGAGPELWRTYGLGLLRVKPWRAVPVVSVQRICVPDHEARFEAVLAGIQSWQALGRPVLIVARKPEDAAELIGQLRTREVDAVLAKRPGMDRPAQEALLPRAAHASVGQVLVTYEADLADLDGRFDVGSSHREWGVLLPEPLDSRRAERSLLSRAGLLLQAPQALQLLSPLDPCLSRSPFGALPGLKLLARAWPAAACILLRTLLWAARRHAQREGRRSRHLLFVRERMIRQQLAFAGRARPQTNTTPGGVLPAQDTAHRQG